MPTDPLADLFDAASRRDFMIAGVTILSTGSTSLQQPQLDSDPDNIRGAALLVGPPDARPPPDADFFNNKLRYTYIYKSTGGDTYYIETNKDGWFRLHNTAVSFKAHRPTAITSPTTNTWTTIDAFQTVTDESPANYITLDSDTQTLTVHRNGLYRFHGCFKIQNQTTGVETASVLIRLLANGSTELRCSQRQLREEFNADSEATLTYGGTDVLVDGDTIELQYYTDNSSITFAADSVFDDPVAVTISADFLGPLP